MRDKIIKWVGENIFKQVLVGLLLTVVIVITSPLWAPIAAISILGALAYETVFGD